MWSEWKKTGSDFQLQIRLAQKGKTPTIFIRGKNSTSIRNQALWWVNANVIFFFIFSGKKKSALVFFSRGPHSGAKRFHRGEPNVTPESWSSRVAAISQKVRFAKMLPFCKKDFWLCHELFYLGDFNQLWPLSWWQLLSMSTNFVLQITFSLMLGSCKMCYTYWPFREKHIAYLP